MRLRHAERLLRSAVHPRRTAQRLYWVSRDAWARFRELGYGFFLPFGSRRWRAFHLQRNHARTSLATHDLSLLTDEELDTSPPSIRLFSAAILTKADGVEEGGDDRSGRLLLDSNSQPVTISPMVPQPLLELATIDRAGVEIKAFCPGDQEPYRDFKERIVHFEFDTSPLFDSPNCWHFPPLLPRIDGVDRTTPHGLAFYATLAKRRDYPSPDPQRTSDTHFFDAKQFAPRLPMWSHDLEVRHLRDLAARLRTADDDSSTIRSVFQYVYFNISPGADVRYKSPLQVLRSKVGGCGHVNALAAWLLELNGIRVRLVSGFDPTLRNSFPGAGHTALEYLDKKTDCWVFMDPYLGVWLDGRSAAELPEDAEAQSVSLASIGLGDSGSSSASTLSLARVFRHRRYMDVAERCLPAYIGQMNNERDYGRNWMLVGSAETPVIEDNEGHIDDRAVCRFARARFVLSNEPLSHSVHLPENVGLLASGWSPVLTLPTEHSACTK